MSIQLEIKVKARKQFVFLICCCLMIVGIGVAAVVTLSARRVTLPVRASNSSSHIGSMVVTFPITVDDYANPSHFKHYADTIDNIEGLGLAEIEIRWPASDEAERNIGASWHVLQPIIDSARPVHIVISRDESLASNGGGWTRLLSDHTFNYLVSIRIPGIEMVSIDDFFGGMSSTGEFEYTAP